LPESRWFDYAMLIRSLGDIKPFIAGDGSRLRELLNGKKDPDLAGVGYSLAHAVVQPGMVTTPHVLTHSEVYYILAGQGVMHIDKEVRDVSEGDAVYIPPGAVQSIECVSGVPLEFLCIVDPAWEPSCETILGFPSL
jgi:mannose-6-phosphate isomerase-like protein (cupin superfamily)